MSIRLRAVIGLTVATAQSDAGRFSISSLGLGVGIADCVLVVLAVGYTVLATRSWRDEHARARGNGVAAQAVGSVIAVSATGASVLMAATGVLLGLGGGDRPIPDQAFSQLTLTAVWLVASLVCGSVSASYVLTHVHHTESVAENHLVVGSATAQLVSLGGGAIFFVIGLFLL